MFVDDRSWKSCQSLVATSSSYHFGLYDVLNTAMRFVLVAMVVLALTANASARLLRQEQEPLAVAGTNDLRDQIIADTVDNNAPIDDYKNLSIFSKALEVTGLHLFSLSNATLLVPTDAAFKKRLSELDITTEQLLAPDPKSRQALSDLLLHNLIQGVYITSNITDGARLTTMLGDDIIADVDDAVLPPKVSFRNVVGARYEASVNADTRDVSFVEMYVQIMDDVLVPDRLLEVLGLSASGAGEIEPL